MSLVRRAFERRAADPRGEWGDSTPPPPSGAGGTLAGAMVSERSALQLAAVYGSMGVIADSFSSLPIDLMNSPHRRSGETLAPSPLVTQPYAEISRIDWWVQFVMSIGLRGNFHGQIVERDRNLYPTQIKPIHPDNAQVRRLANGRVEYRYNGKLVPIDDVFHVRYLSVAGSLVGLNPIEYLRNVLGGALATDQYGNAFFQNSARADVVLESEDALDPSEAVALAKAWKAAHQGIGRSSLPAVLTGGLKLTQPITVNPQDAQFLETRQYGAATISGQIFRVPPHMVGIVDKTTSWGCLPGDSQVFTTAGPRPIEDVKVGDEVWSLTDDGMAPAKVTGWVMTGYKPLLHIHTIGRTVRATSAHHIPVRRYFGVKDGRKHGECRWETLLVDAKDVRKGDYLMVPNRLKPRAGRQAPNGRDLTVAAMEMCGLYIGDGSMDKNRVEIAHEREPDHMTYYSQVVRDEFGVEPYVDSRRTRTRFSSTAACDLLNHGNFTGTALTKRVPGWVFDLEPDLQLGFLRGYLDADGSVQKGRIIYSSANKLLLEDVRHLCIQLGIPSGRVCHGRDAGPMEIRGRTYMSQIKWMLSLSGLPFNSRIGSNSPRKAARFDDTPHGRVQRYDEGWTGTDDNAQGAGFDWPHADVTLQRVTKVEESPLRVPVYDIEVAGPATYVADGVVVGNTGIEQQELGFVRNTLVGYLSRGEEALTAVHPPGQFVKFDLSERLRGDRLQRAQANALEIASGTLLPDEGRAMEDRSPLPGGIGQTAQAPINAQSLKELAEGSIAADKQRQQEQQIQAANAGGDSS